MILKVDTHTHTVASGALFDTEFIPPGTEFAFKVAAENLTLTEAIALGALLWIFAQGSITIGGRGRAGFGEVLVAGLSMKLISRGPNPYEFKHVEEPITDERTINDMLSRNNASAPEPKDHSKKPADKGDMAHVQETEQ